MVAALFAFVRSVSNAHLRTQAILLLKLMNSTEWTLPLIFTVLLVIRMHSWSDTGLPGTYQRKLVLALKLCLSLFSLQVAGLGAWSIIQA
jgi:hypothetical protein